MAHALLGPSSASRWMACPPSVNLTKDMPDTTSEYAAEGSLAHEIAELKLKKKIVDPGMSARKFNAEMKKLKGRELYQEEMQEFTDIYVDFIQEQMCACENTPYVAVEQKVDFSQYVPQGFGTADCILISGDMIHIIDFKYGRGVVVDAEENPQMLLYTLGAYLAYNFLYDIKRIQMSIVQPRVSHFSSWECDVDYLLSFAEKAKEKALMASEGQGEFQAGKHCKFCKAKTTCRTRAEENLELEGWQYALPPLLKTHEVGHILKKAEDLAAWAKELKEWALSECLNGNEIPGWKAVHGRGSRSFTNTDEAVKVLVEKGIAEELLYERKYLTLAQMEKVIGKKDFQEMVGDYIEMKQGSPTLVVESDKRQAITNRIKAEEEFSAVEDIDNL
ncbi:DUF2800 domain-containing protein [Fusobacterium necrophorum]|uniref:DUF2800 domain-containing protein n=2 Tax=Fusobacterium necrophorum TaxID=859 RepID=A0AB73BWY7_9FUSO|nr:DUF2800 domain-containing protein [Fusobacterium necrophorum]AYZ73433.1 DUF2800 domain-containing protein [Fusobacterium necrophorum]AZW08570.1 DUF2800 domain-containing protein [Fusobacterium necrophorum subsp. necrophorum]KDE63792.1 hypothetical protein FUSO3_04490 [Fusobacterium necrophorum BL]SDB41137.1 Protein of unknown function [Fusobacterium necrophorum]SQD09493.1 Protein of uncharacterised function (DUF2800) [Fusobacterium necrophorum subsp. necrophorum]